MAAGSRSSGTFFSRAQSKAPRRSSIETESSCWSPQHGKRRGSGREMETIRNVQMYGWLAERMDPVWKSRSATSAGHTGAGRRPECVCVTTLSLFLQRWKKYSNAATIQVLRNTPLCSEALKWSNTQKPTGTHNPEEEASFLEQRQAPNIFWIKVVHPHVLRLTAHTMWPLSTHSNLYATNTVRHQTHLRVLHETLCWNIDQSPFGYWTQSSFIPFGTSRLQFLLNDTKPAIFTSCMDIF